MLVLGLVHLAVTLPWRSAGVPAPALQAKESLSAVLKELAWPVGPEPDLVLLSVPQTHAADLDELSAETARALDAKLLVGVVGSGVIGGGHEFDANDEGGISILVHGIRYIFV